MHGRRRASRPRRPNRPEPAHRPPARVHERSHVQRRQIERHRRARVIRRRRSRREIDHARRRGDDAPSHDGVPRGHVPAADATARARRAIALHEGWIRIAHQRPRDDRRRRHRARARAMDVGASRVAMCVDVIILCRTRRFVFRDTFSRDARGDGCASDASDDDGIGDARRGTRDENAW